MIHEYTVVVEWQGNLGNGTSNYTSYSRDYLLQANGKHEVSCSSDPKFRGDKLKWNPEELFISSISACHKLWYLHLCADNGVEVLSYIDTVKGIMADGNGKEKGRIGFLSVTLNPEIKISREVDIKLAVQLHMEIHKYCFIANSINFDIFCHPSVSSI